MQERIAKDVGDLQHRPQHHRKQKEDCHLRFFKQDKGVQTELAGKRGVCFLLSNRDFRQRQRIQSQQ